MKRLLFGVSFLFSVVFQVNAQQKAQFTQYMTNSYLINPALAGAEDFVDLKAGYRQQWVGFDGAPTTFYVSGHSPIGEQHEYYHYKGEHVNWHGAGALIMKDEAGAISQTSFLASYSYNMGITKGRGHGRNKKAGIRASFALSAGFQQFTLDGSKLEWVDDQADVASNVPYSKLLPDANLGAWVYDDDFYVGLSVQQLLGTRIEFEGADLGTTDLSRLSQHYILTGGYRIPISYDDIAFIPSFLVKGVTGAPMSFDLNGKFEYHHMLWAGLSYRHNDALAILVGALINYQYEVAYSFDFTTTDIRSHSQAGTHEITIGYRLLPRKQLHNAEDHWRGNKVHK
jgi:type IX secretion system PorP/SprF family membrane protein